MTNLRSLRLDSNQIEKLPLAMLTGPLEIIWPLDLFGGICLRGNPLKFPPAEIVEAGVDILARMMGRA